MPALAMEFGWRRVLSAVEAGPATWLLAATLGGGASASMAQLNATTPTEQAETTALVARMTTAPGAARRTLIDNAIAGLKADGVWAKLDWLVVLAAHDAQAARLNWKPGSKALSAVNSPTFTVDRGYAGDGATAWLDFGEPASAGGQYALASAALFAWCNVQGSTANKTLIGAISNSTPYAVINVNAAGQETAILNNGTNLFRTGTSKLGLRGVTRSGTSVTTFLGAAQSGTGTSTATAIPASNLGLLVNGVNFSSERIAAAGSGAALTAGEMAALHGRLNTFLSAIGAN